MVTEGQSKPLSSLKEMRRTWPWSRMDLGLPKPCRNKSANKGWDCSQVRSSHKPPPLKGALGWDLRGALHMNSPC